MPAPLYMSNDGKRIGTIAAMRAYEAETGAPLDAEQEEILVGIVNAARLKEQRQCSVCAENWTLINLVQKAVIMADRGDLNTRKEIIAAWGNVDAEFRRIYGDPE